MTSKQGTIAAGKLKTNPEEILKRVVAERESLVVEHHSFPVMAIMPYDDYRRMVAMEKLLTANSALWELLEKELDTTIDELQNEKC